MRRALAASSAVALIVATAPSVLAQDQVPKFIASLENPNQKMRLQAVVAIGNHGTGARSAAPALMALIDRERDPQTALQAVQALTQIGAHAQLRQLLKHQTPAIRWQAANGLGLIGPPAKKAVPELVRLLSDGDPVLRCLAAGAIGEIGLQTEDDARRVIKLMLCADADTRPHFLYALMNLGPSSVPALSKLLDNGDAEAVQLASMQALANQGSVAKEAVPNLTKLLRDPSAAIRAQAAATLATMGVDAKDALPTLLENLLDKDVQVQTYSFQATITVGQADRKALLDGLKAANSKGRWVAPAFGNGLVGKEAVAALLKDLSAKEPDKRAMAALALGRLGKDAEPAIPALARMAKEENKQVRNAAQQALAQLDQKERETYLRKLQADQARWLRDAKADWAKFSSDSAAEATKLKNLPGQLRLQMVKIGTEKLSVVTKNAPRQAYIRQLVQMHMALSSMVASSKRQDQDPPPEADWVRERLSLLGPEAVPAFLDGYNYGISYDVGFV